MHALSRLCIADARVLGALDRAAAGGAKHHENPLRIAVFGARAVFGVAADDELRVLRETIRFDEDRERLLEAVRAFETIGALGACSAEEAAAARADLEILARELSPWGLQLPPRFAWDPQILGDPWHRSWGPTREALTAAVEAALDALRARTSDS